MPSTPSAPPTRARFRLPSTGSAWMICCESTRSKLSGILNGVDYEEWNPETGPYQVAHYSARDLSGKLASKKALLAEMGLPPNTEPPADRNRVALRRSKRIRAAGRHRRLAGGSGCGDGGARLRAEEIRGHVPAACRIAAGEVRGADRLRRRAVASHRGRGRHVPDAVAIRTVRAQPDLQPALRNRADCPGHRWFGRYGG